MPVEVIDVSSFYCSSELTTLQALDVCVEIPQFGVTRSLNVHVSGALLVWEYIRQHHES